MPHKIFNWKEEFEKSFGGTIPNTGLYDFDQIDETRNILDFISLVEGQAREEAIKEIIGMVEGMKEVPRNSIDVGSYETTVVGQHNHTLDQVLSLLKEKLTK